MKSAANSRRHRSFGSLWLALLLFSTIASLTVQLPLHAEDNSDNWVSSTREANKASLVFITGNVKHKNGDVAPFAGTGFIVSSAGHVLTCNHVIPEYDPDVDTLQCSGSVGGRYELLYPLTIVDSEKQGDLMLLILPQEKTWPSVRSMAKGQLDSEIVVLGFPIDKPLLAATGRITSTERGRFITNAALNHGMSGGPAFDKSGAIIGIAEGGYEEANSINLLIPISYATRLLQIADSPLVSPTPTQVATATSTGITRNLPPSPTPLPSIGMGKTLWENLRNFMRWDAFPKDYKALLDACVVNGAAAGLIYFLCVLVLYSIAPARFVIWHEWIATAGIPFSERIAKTLAPFLLDTPHTLNAIVLRYRDRARKLFDDAQEVKDRQKWVPAPLQIDDEVLYDYKRPPTLPSQRPYIAGLMELQTHLGLGSKHFDKQRSIVSIEGPGGVGKSALAFQIARWASDSRADYQLARFPILPVLLESLGSDSNKLNNVDEAAADSVRFIMETSKISAPLLQGLLRRKRVLVVVDGVSEMSKQAADVPIRPDKGAVNTRFLVLTSRLPTNLLESNVIRPQELTSEVLDRVLDDLIAANVGSRRFNDAGRETLRMRIRSLIKDAGEYEKERQVPMIFIKLMIERADQLLKEGKQLAELPTSLAELVTEYTEQLLRNEDLTLAVQQARMAAHVCMGKERISAARSENLYTAKGLSKEMLNKFVAAGLMVGSGAKSDPLFKFALDPIAEQLDANRLLIGIRDGSADQTEIDDLMHRWEDLPKDFVQALRRAASPFRETICSNQSVFSLKLWPEKEITEPLAIFIPSLSPINRAFNRLHRLLTVIDPDYGESRWQWAHDFEALPATQRKPGHWYHGRSGHDFFHVDEYLNGQWFKKLPLGVDEHGVIELPRLNAPSLLASLKSLIERLPAEQGDTRKRLEDLLTNLTALSQPDHPRAQVQKFRQEAFAAFQAGQSLLLEFLDKSAEYFSGDGLSNGQVTGIEAGAVLLLRELARTIATPRPDGSEPPPFQLARTLGMLSAPGATSLEMMAGQFVRDCLSNGFTGQTLTALAKLQTKANEAVESAREGLYPVGHPEMMLDLYYFGLFLAAPSLRAVMVGYEVLGTQPGFIDEARPPYSSWAYAAEEKLVSISDAMLFAIRDLDGAEARRRRDEIQALIQAGQAEKAQGLAMSLVDLKLFFPKPFKRALLERTQDRREERKDFLQERQALYRQLGLSLARIMNYDPPDPEWNPAKEKFYEIYWGEIRLFADEAVMKVVEPFSDVLHRAKTKQDKEALTNQVSAITEACRKSLGDAWKDRREERKDFLQALYRRLGVSLARIMNYDPPDPEWNPAKEKFYEIYWGEIRLFADEAVMKVVEPFSDVLHRAKTKQDKEALTNQVSAITEACRKSLGDAWKDIKKAEEQSSHVV